MISQLTTSRHSELLEAVKTFISDNFLFYGGYYFELDDNYEKFRLREGCHITAITKDEIKQKKYDEDIVKKMNI